MHTIMHTVVYVYLYSLYIMYTRINDYMPTECTVELYTMKLNTSYI